MESVADTFANGALICYVAWGYMACAPDLLQRVGSCEWRS